MESRKFFSRNGIKKLLTAMIAIVAMANLIMPSFASADAICDGLAEKTKGFLSCGTDNGTTTFTDFNGSLSAPDGSGYAGEIGKSTDARAFVIKVVNFALGFLGLLAVLVVIYGGFMYVTDLGKGEQTEKAKKAITYAIIGILIILSSFALVNTILKAGTGSDQSPDSLHGSANGPGDQNSNRRAFFNYAGVIVQSVAHDLVSAYENYSQVNDQVTLLKNADTLKNVSSVSEFKGYVTNLKDALTNIITKAGPLSQVAEVANKIEIGIDKFVTTSNKTLIDNQVDENGWAAFWRNGDNQIAQQLLDQVNPQYDAMLKANQQDFAVAVVTARQKLNDVTQRVEKALNVNIKDVAVQDITTAFAKADADFKNIASQISDTNNVGTVSIDPTKVTLNHPDQINNALIVSVVSDLSNLYDLVKNVQFIYTVINADVTEGNAPLIVNFDGLKSLDPRNQTITDDQYTWDFGVDCSDPLQDCGDKGSTQKGGVTKPFTFKKAGTYIVKLVISAKNNPNDPTAQQIADGVAYVTIKVKPSSSRIGLVALSNQAQVVLSEYNNDGQQIFNRSEVSYTLKEAQQGIKFDASKTADGTGHLFTDAGSSQIVKMKWDFGDKSNKNTLQEGSPAGEILNPTFLYNKEGAYRVMLEVTDSRGITDRKIFTVNVNSIAARLNISPSDVITKNHEITIDASGSGSDGGQIKTYAFKLTNLNPNAEPAANPKNWFTPPASQNISTFKQVFKYPGTYKLDLEVSNGDKTGTTSKIITVEAKPPLAQFSYQSVDPSQPNTYYFDGSKSIIPDSDSQTLLYKWETNAAPGNCSYFVFDAVNQKYVADAKDCAKDLQNEGKDGFADHAKLKIQFKKGKYTVDLTVKDPQNNTASGTGAPQEQNITVENDLDIAWGVDSSGRSIMPQSANLKTADGLTQAKITFSIVSLKATSYEMSTGDNQQEKGTFDPGKTTQTFTHTYATNGVYKVHLSVYDAEENENSLDGRVYISSSDAPVAVISAKVDNVESFNDPLRVSRKNVVTFDGSKSLNLDGTNRHLDYTWMIVNKDGITVDQKNAKQFTYTFKEIGNYKVKLKVSSQDNPGKVSLNDEVMNMNVMSLPPTLSGLSATLASPTNKTPVTVNVAAIGAGDPDGKIMNYRWWYYPADLDPNDPINQYGVQVTNVPVAAIQIPTNGAQDEKKVYKFAVSITDNENNIYSSAKDLTDEQIPFIQVVNGVNQLPIPKFTVDHTNILVNDTVNFVSGSTDANPDGKIVKYIWDFEGKGFDAAEVLYGPAYNKPNVTFKYTTPNKDGYKVRLKVVNAGNAEAYTDIPVTIYVDSNAKPPVANFLAQQIPNTKKVQFTNTSVIDAAGGANLKTATWDFDTANNSALVNKTSNLPNPTYEYQDYGSHSVKLTVTDDQGGTANVTKVINLINSAPPVQPLKNSAPIVKLEPHLLSTPAPSYDNKIHLQGDSQDIQFDFSTSKGPIAKYVIDKYTNYDSDGDNNFTNDVDFSSATPIKWTTNYARISTPTRVRLTVYDATGTVSSYVEKDIIFDAQPKSNTKMLNFVLAGYGSVDSPLLLVSVMGFGIFVTTMTVLKKRKLKAEKSESVSDSEN